MEDKKTISLAMCIAHERKVKMSKLCGKRGWWKRLIFRA